MLAITHLVVSILLIQMLTLDRNDSFVALLFGVFIDVDHLLGLKDYAEAHGITSVLDVDSLMHADGQWKSLLHNPVAAMVVGPVSAGSRLALPLVFWGVHVSMDYIEEALLGNFSVWEMTFLAVTSTALAGICYRRFSLANPEQGFIGFLRHVVSWLASPWRTVIVAVSGRRGP